ncbi:hypothetical protein [Nonomuraea sp. NPDC048916]|uniref:hypothetical protein n=1 Tax=Nonomuraea sp. NPDC048916 TaxID=3154232 RepID=UPI0034110953
MTPQGGWPVSSALLVLAITWLATSLDLFNFLNTDTGYLYLHEVIGMPTSLMGLLWLGTPPTGFVLALLCGRKVAILFGLAVAVVGIRIISTMALLFWP